MLSDDVKQLRRTAGQLAHAGYVVLDGFLAPGVVQALRRETDIALRAPSMPGCERPHNRLVPLRWNDPIVALVLDEAKHRQAIARFTGANDLRWISGYVSVKQAHTPALWWHQDWWCWDHPVSLRPAAAQIALLCYLSDTSEHNAALRVLPGSHHRSLPLHAMLPEAHAQADELPPDHVALSDQSGQLTLGVRAGDAVVLDYRLLHGTHANDSAYRRDCVLLSFTPSWRGLPADIRAHLIQHLAQPSAEERRAAASAWQAELLPSFAGVPIDLELNRVAPAHFAVATGRA